MHLHKAIIFIKKMVKDFINIWMWLTWKSKTKHLRRSTDFTFILNQWSTNFQRRHLLISVRIRINRSTIELIAIRMEIHENWGAISISIRLQYSMESNKFFSWFIQFWTIHEPKYYKHANSYDGEEKTLAKEKCQT